jgi:NAD(P)-dependent dehydrogenase (short-subunit alcohol dehydrogenase family)
MPKPLMVRPELLKLDLSSRTYVVTGANSGIGLVTARQLAAQGAEVVLACRNPEQGKRAAAQIRAEVPHARVEVRTLDLGSLASVRAFASTFNAEHSSLHGLVNNAGVMNTPRGKTVDGFETQFGVNHLGHFLLTQLLTDALKRGAPSRVVNLASAYHDRAMGRDGAIHFDDLNFERRKYDGWEAYAQSKLANVLHAQQLALRLRDSGVTCVSVHPGWVRTALLRNSSPLWVQDIVLRPIFQLMGMIEPWEGAQSTLHALLAPEVAEQSGQYFSQTGIYRDKSCNRGGWPLKSPNPNAHDSAAAARLWDVSAQLVGVAP